MVSTTVALESTGVYWIPLFEILEQRGIRPCLVNARHMKKVPGRRTDWHECQWLQFLHSVGLLRAAFRPGQDICAIRTLLRHRNELVSAASQHVQHMHKALTQMNLQIHHVINDITGVTGRAIVDAILAGQRDGAELAKLRDPHIKADSHELGGQPLPQFKFSYFYEYDEPGNWKSRSETWEVGTQQHARRSAIGRTIRRAPPPKDLRTVRFLKRDQNSGEISSIQLRLTDTEDFAELLPQ
jgi:hypothetical protein